MIDFIDFDIKYTVVLTPEIVFYLLHDLVRKPILVARR